MKNYFLIIRKILQRKSGKHIRQLSKILHRNAVVGPFAQLCASWLKQDTDRKFEARKNATLLSRDEDCRSKRGTEIMRPLKTQHMTWFTTLKLSAILYSMNLDSNVFHLSNHRGRKLIYSGHAINLFLLALLTCSPGGCPGAQVFICSGKK